MAGVWARADADYIRTGPAPCAGSTAVVGLVLGRRLYVANVGDSRALLVGKGGAVTPLSTDHKPDRPDESARISDAGGCVLQK